MALHDRFGELTYGELRETAQSFGRQLRDSHKSPIVPIRCRRDRYAIISMLSAASAGKCFLPIDSLLPAGRQQEILEDSFADGIVDATLGPDPEWIKRTTVGRLSHEDWQLAERACYLLYTSGSTGKPNGVLVGFDSLDNLLSEIERLAPLPSRDVRCSWWTSVGFDVAVYEVFSALLYGRTLCIPDDTIRRSSLDLISWMNEEEINSAYLPPFFIESFASLKESGRRSESLHRLLVGVEPIEQQALVSIIDRHPNLRIVNGYGPTEATICATLYPVSASDHDNGPAPIGSPVCGNEIRVVDRHDRVLPPGISGELQIAGVGLALGYWRRPELNDKRFYTESSNNRRWYRTGDRVRFRADGILQYLGRADDQIKLLGHRVELGEISSAIRDVAGVDDCAVLTDDSGPRKEVIAAVVCSADVNESVIREEIATRLPLYFIPRRILFFDTLPRTVNSKVDRDKILDLADDQEGSARVRDDERPRSTTEFAIFEIWKRILGLDKLRRDENLFHLGADSMQAHQCASALCEIGLETDVTDLFRNPSIISLANFLGGANARGSVGASGSHTNSSRHFFSADR